MNENEITFDGVTYVAAERATCEGCAFDRDIKRCGAAIIATPCGSNQRSDNRSVIWMTMTNAAVHRLKGTT